MQGDLADVADAEIGVQRLLAAERRGAAVLNLQFHRQCRAKGKAMTQRPRAPSLRPERNRLLVRLQPQNEHHRSVVLFRRRFQRPLPRPREAVRRFILPLGVRPEPRKNHRSPAANRLPRLETRPLAFEENRPASGRGELRDLRAVQIDLRPRQRRSDLQPGQPTPACVKLDGTRKFECGFHHFLLYCNAPVRICEKIYLVHACIRHHPDPSLSMKGKPI